jgi:molybdenum cofactor synthesis domain-containing protein
LKTASAVIVGDEILSGKVREENLPRLIALLREVGVPLRRVVVIPDEVEAIAEEVARHSAADAWVVTSGGVGPTHDDCTVEGVARAFAVGVVRSPQLETMVRGFWGERITDAALRLADIPQGARLLYGHDRLLPLVVMRNVYLFPGVPRLFEAKLPSLRPELAGAPLFQGSLTLLADETDIAAVLSQVARERSGVKIGSYPQGRRADRRVWVTVEGRVRSEVVEAIDLLIALLPPEAVASVER